MRKGLAIVVCAAVAMGGVGCMLILGNDKEYSECRPGACATGGGFAASSSSGRPGSGSASGTGGSTSEGGGGAAIVCAEGKTSCGKACVDTKTDPQSCGACGHDCQGGECKEGVCQPVVLNANQAAPQHLFLFKDQLYWTNYVLETGSVVRMPAKGGAAEVLAQASEPGCVAASTSGVYWAVSNSEKVMWLPTGSSFPQKLALAYGPWFVSVDEAFVYWAEWGGPAKIRKAPSSGGAPVDLVLGYDFPRGMVIDDTRIYWTSGYDNGSIVSALKSDGSSLTVIATDGWNVQGIAVDEAYVYWVDKGGGKDGRVRRAPKTKGPVEAIASEQNLPEYIAVDSDAIYWTVGEAEGALMKASKKGGSTAVLVAGLSTPKYVVVDETALYWINSGTNTIMKLVK